MAMTITEKILADHARKRQHPPCLGGYNGVLRAEEVCVSTSNPQIPRAHGAQAKVYLASPAVAAATAIRGKLAVPEEVAGRD